MNKSENLRLAAVQTAAQHAKESFELSGLMLTVAHGEGPSHTIAVGSDEKGHPLGADSLFPVGQLQSRLTKT